MAMNYGRDRSAADQSFWNTVNRNKMADADSIWGGVVSGADSRARALGLPSISQSNVKPIYTNRPGDTPRGGAHGEVWSPEYGSRVHPMVPGGGTPFKIPDGPALAYGMGKDAPRLGSSSQLPSLGDMSDPGYARMLGRAQNGHYLDNNERQALLQRYGKDLPGLLANPGAGAGVRMNDWKKRTDRLRAMAEALGVGDAGDAGAASDPTYTTSVGSPSGGMSVGASGGGGASGGANPYSAPGQVPAPGYMGMSSPQPVDTMLSGNDYLQNMAQTKRLQRQNRIAGIDPRAAQLMGQAQQNASRGFMGEKGLMEQGMANQANAAAMGFNSDMYRNRVGESLGLGSLGLQDATRRDVASESSAKTRMMEEEQRRRGALMDQLMGVTADSSAPQSSTGSGFLDAAMNGFGETRVPMAPNGAGGPSGGDAFGGDMWKKAFAYDQLSPGLGTSLAKGEMDKRQQPNPEDAYSIAAMNALSQGGDAAGAAQIYKERMASNGVGVPGMPITSGPPKDASGNPKVNADYIRNILSQLPADMPMDQKLKSLQASGISQTDIENAYDNAGPSWMQSGLEEAYNAPWYDPSKWISKGMAAMSNPQARSNRNRRAEQFRSQLEALLGGGGSGASQSQWLNSPQTEPRR